jgi:membrane protein required for colicin V production
MTVADYLILAVVLLSALVGLLRGFLREVIALVTWVLAVFVAWRFAGLVEPHLGGLLANPSVRPWAARTILFILVLMIGWGVASVLVHFVRLSIFSGLDRFLGLLFGLLRGVVIVGVVVILAQTLRLDGERWWRRSMLVPFGEQVAGVLRGIAGDKFKERGAVSARLVPQAINEGA